MKEEELKKEIKILKKFPMNKRGKEIKLMELSLIEIQKEAELKGFQEGRQSKLKDELEFLKKIKEILRGVGDIGMLNNKIKMIEKELRVRVEE